MTKIEYLDLGIHPIANEYVTPGQDKAELFFHLSMGVDDETGMSSLMHVVDSRTVYTDTYAYHSSGSETMRNHFADAAAKLKKKWSPQVVLEIGSNDGVFLKHFYPGHETMDIVGVEPCANFANITDAMGICTFDHFWNKQTAQYVTDHTGREIDLIYSANCMCHIPDLVETFQAVKDILSENGVFVFEDPTLLNMFKNGSFDQVYVEHVHMFTVCALSRILNVCGLEIIDVEHLDVHGGSNRITVGHLGKHAVDFDSVAVAKTNEVLAGLDLITQTFQADNLITSKPYENSYYAFGQRTIDARDDLVTKLLRFRADDKKVISYGATAKSTTVFNYCNIGPDLIEYIIDNTPSKQGKLSPGMGIPIVAPEDGGIADDVDAVYLGAWNFEKEICKKEANFLDRGGMFITHVPAVRQITKLNAEC